MTPVVQKGAIELFLRQLFPFIPGFCFWWILLLLANWGPRDL